MRLLEPFLDNKGLIRIGGRLGRANLPFEQKGPFLVSRNNEDYRIYSQRGSFGESGPLRQGTFISSIKRKILDTQRTKNGRQGFEGICNLPKI